MRFAPLSRFPSALALFLFSISGVLSAGAAPSAEHRQETLRQQYSKLPLTFENNRGQAGPDVRFLSRAPGFTALLKDREVEFIVPNSLPPDARSAGIIRRRGTFCWAGKPVRMGPCVELGGLRRALA